MVFWLIMKLLLDERIERTDGEIKLTIKPVTTSQQARLIDLGGISGTTARIALTHYCLKNCIEKIAINNAEFDPSKLSDRADLSDHETLLVMIKIGQMVCDVAFPEAEDVKKSQQQPAPGA
jgi:hypothetical protein